MAFFYLSFADPKKPEGEQFLGATIIEAPTDTSAITVSHMLGVNPGGEVLFVELPIESASELPEEAQKYIGRFVPREVVMAEGAYL